MTRFLQMLARDLSYALRTMRKNPAFAGMAVLTLALGIGGTTAMFTVIRSVLLKPLTYRDPDRLVQLSKGATSTRFAEMQAAARSYAGVGAYLQTALDITLSGGPEPEVVKGMSVSANFLDILEVQPLLGRGFRSEEDGKGAPPVVLLSADLWQRRFNGDPAILGRSITLESRACTVIGVLPGGFQFPHPEVDIWVPGPSNYVNTTSPRLSVFGRLLGGVTIDQSTVELTVLNQHYRMAHPGMLDGKWDGKSNPLERVERLKDRLVDNVRPMLWILFGAVGFVLLIGCANVASLLLAQAASRSREFAVRSAIGASRWRIINQLLAESLVLAAAGGAVGVLLARWSLLAIAQMTALDLPRANEIRLDGMVLGFAVLLSMGTCAIFGLIPSLSASRPDLAAVLRASGEAAGSTGRKRLGLALSPRGALVILQVALSMVLLMESLGRLYSVNPGFDPSHLLTLRVSLPRAHYDSGRSRQLSLTNSHAACRRCREFAGPQQAGRYPWLRIQ
jgi:putative ABC transport system permease protein